MRLKMRSVGVLPLLNAWHLFRIRFRVFGVFRGQKLRLTPTQTLRGKQEPKRKTIT
jgi:hypothetical protein